MAYVLLLIAHLLCAAAFIGVVFAEVMLMPAVKKRLPRPVALLWEKEFGRRARRIMPPIVLALYLAGVGLAWFHRGALAHPLQSSFALLLTVKIALAASVAGHVATALILQRRKRLTASRSDLIHRSVLAHVLLIAVIAKAMFHVAP
ncbi:hypothetical protein CSC71_10780 [Pseudoxanthomonas sangjuensis]|uniref:CopD family copper resistance protein n=1 Tax=Pseudoxanthomonas sangjuensis TaxID=1503750 RepID=UPI001390C274|nr:hypothetical protein [Pseudoxanthomonas sangjuensis]KAF1709718.1 hypothetical protein CSC71_10780 [Pseudoxanthomonas sangjuensis]